jgi:hypothetical protein
MAFFFTLPSIAIPLVFEKRVSSRCNGVKLLFFHLPVLSTTHIFDSNYDYMNVAPATNESSVYGYHFMMICPHCSIAATMTAISVPTYGLINKYNLKDVGICYMCNNCKSPVFLRFNGIMQKGGTHGYEINPIYESIQNPLPAFEFEFLPEQVEVNFKEALLCYSVTAYNGFAAMCRRCIQATATELGAKGRDKVTKQLDEMKEIAQIDDETQEIIKKIIVDRHDGSHPHLPEVSKTRADLLLEFMKDVLYQLFVRAGKIKKANELRISQIQNRHQP